MAAEFEGNVEQIHRAFSDEQYWLTRLADSGADDYSLDKLEVDPAGGIDIKTTQVLRVDRLPLIATQFHRGDLSIAREERWTPIRDGRATAEVYGSIEGAPADLRGEAVLAPTESGARLEFTVSVEVRVPLVGGKIENLIGNQLTNLVIAEQRFTTVWISENA